MIAFSLKQHKQLVHYVLQAPRQLATVSTTAREQASDGECRRNPFFSVAKWNKKTLTDYLVESLIYNEDGLVVVNKPYGVTGTRENPIGLAEVLPDLAKRLGHKELTPVLKPDKYSSGLTILSTKTDIFHKVRKRIARAKTLPDWPSLTFWAVTIGKPLYETDYNKYGVAEERRVGQRGSKKVILREWTTRAVKRKEVYIGRIGQKLLDAAPLASLVSLSTYLTRSHTPRIYLSDVQLSPVLGDSVFGPRVSSLQGRKFLISPWAASDVMHLSKDFLGALHMNAGEENFIPAHLHLHEYQLDNFPQKGKILMLQAAPPAHFCWSCQQLGLSLPPTQSSRVENSLPQIENSDQAKCEV